MDYQSEIKSLKPQHNFFIGIDSDGCVFDSMEVKQKEFFIPNALKYFNLFAISRVVRETWEFVNLYSIYRGGNRFSSLLKVFELLEHRKDVIESGCRLPDLSSLRQWVSSETKLGNASLRKYFESHYNPDLEKVVSWTEALNEDIGKWLVNIPPFPHALEAIRNISASADLMIVSQTPLEALEREWKETGMRKYLRAIAAQEHGTKTEQISMAAIGKYDKDKMLMIGDAKGDLDAAKNNGILFFPVIPGNEDSSWTVFINEGYNKFTTGNFRGKYEEKLINEFLRSLPSEITI